MTTHTPLARYSATNGALVSGFATAELHHLMGHDQVKAALGRAQGETRKKIVFDFDKLVSHVDIIRGKLKPKN